MSGGFFSMCGESRCVSRKSEKWETQQKNKKDEVIGNFFRQLNKSGTNCVERDK